MRLVMPEVQHLEPPRKTDVHTIEECDMMLALDLTPEVSDAWLDERLSCMKAQAFDREVV